MIKAIFIILFSFLVSQTICGQSQEKTFEDDEIKSIYHLTQGRFNGNYISYYKNGIKKAEGNYENNLRIGKWTVWDSLENLRIARIYSDPFTFERIIPKIPTDKPIQLLNIPRYKIEYNTDGYITYAYVKESDVHYHKRIWRYLSLKENTTLFNENCLFKLLYKHILDSTIKAYSTKDDEFTEVFMPEIDTSTVKVIGFKIKEDFFFDMNRIVSEKRIIGICPVVINQETKDTIDTYWVYFPETRKYLAQVDIQNDNLPKKIKTLDDLFFFRYFDGKIYKKSNVYDRQPINFLEPSNSERIDIELIEKEHDIWISLTESPKP